MEAAWRLLLVYLAFPNLFPPFTMGLHFCTLAPLPQRQPIQLFMKAVISLSVSVHSPL